MRKLKKFKIYFDLDSPYKLAFSDYWLSRQLDLTWQALLEEFRDEWNALFGTLVHEDDLEDQDIILYELKFSSNPDFEKSDSNFSLDSVVLDSDYEEEHFFNEDATHIPDDFEFDDFFFEDFFLFFFVCYLFFPFFLLELSFFFAFFFYVQNYSLLNGDETDDAVEEEFCFFLESEADISHYDFAEFFFEEFLPFDEMFLYSGFWKNKPYSKHLKILKTMFK